MSLWMSTCVILVFTYKCNLKAMLTAPKIILPFTNLEDMSSQTAFPYKVGKDTIVEQFLKVRIIF